MYISKLQLENVRKYEAESFSFQPGFNLLVGENGAGKTTLLRAVYAVLTKTNTGRSQQVLGDEDIRLNSNGVLKVTASLAQRDGTPIERLAIYERRLGFRASRPRAGHAPLVLWYGSNEATCSSFVSRASRKLSQGNMAQPEDDEGWLYQQSVPQDFGARESDRFGQSEEINSFVRDILKKFSDKFIDFRWSFEPYGCSIRPPKNKPQNFDSAREIRRKLESAILRHFQETRSPLVWVDKKFVSINPLGFMVGTTEKKPALPPFRDFLERMRVDFKEAAFLEECTAEIRLTPRIRIITGSGESFLLSQLSDGEKRLFSLFVDICRRLLVQLRAAPAVFETTPAVVLIDEIDVHLHPKWQRMIVPALEDMFPGCQFIATTHSPFIVQATPEEKVQQLNGELIHGFQDRGIEEIAVKVMHIENHQVSKRYLDLLDVARDYFLEVEKAKKIRASSPLAEDSKRQLAAIKDKMDGLSQKFARNPAHQAFLELHGALELGEEEIE